MNIRRMDGAMWHFIASFIVADIAVMLAQAMAMWLVYQTLGVHYTTAIALITLFINAFITKKYSHLLDKYPRVYAMSLANWLFFALLVAAWISGVVWLYALILLTTSLYFSCFYMARGAIAQAMMIQRNQAKPKDFRKLNAVLMVTDRLGAILVNVAVAVLFIYLQADGLMLASLATLLFAILLLKKLPEPILAVPPATAQPETTQSEKDRSEKDKPVTSIKSQPENAKETSRTQKTDFAWFFRQPNAYLVVTAVFITVLILVSNTINTIYLYDVLALTPDMAAYPSMAHNIAALTGGLVVVWLQREKLVIYVCFALAVAMALLLALYPKFWMFVVAALIFGLVNSVNRVMYDSVIMKSVSNQQVATFYGYLGSINLSAQFISTGLIQLFLWAATRPSAASFEQLDVAWVVWFYPAVFLLLPWVWVFAWFIHKSRSD